MSESFSRYAPAPYVEPPESALDLVPKPRVRLDAVRPATSGGARHRLARAVTRVTPGMSRPVLQRLTGPLVERNPFGAIRRLDGRTGTVAGIVPPAAPLWSAVPARRRLSSPLTTCPPVRSCSASHGSAWCATRHARSEAPTRSRSSHPACRSGTPTRAGAPSWSRTDAFRRRTNRWTRHPSPKTSTCPGRWPASSGTSITASISRPWKRWPTPASPC